MYVYPSVYLLFHFHKLSPFLPENVDIETFAAHRGGAAVLSSLLSHEKKEEQKTQHIKRNTSECNSTRQLQSVEFEISVGYKTWHWCSRDWELVCREKESSSCPCSLFPVELLVVDTVYVGQWTAATGVPTSWRELVPSASSSKPGVPKKTIHEEI